MKNQELQKQIDKLRKKEDETRSELSDIISQKQKLQQELYTLETGIAIGDDVIISKGRGVVESLNVRYNRIHPIVRMYKKNGELGLIQKTIYHWDSIKKLNK